jgi:hypothetical protein
MSAGDANRERGRMGSQLLHDDVGPLSPRSGGGDCTADPLVG